MTADELKAWLLLAGFEKEFNRYFYMRSGFNKLVTVAILVDETVEVRSFARNRTYTTRPPRYRKFSMYHQAWCFIKKSIRD